MNGSSIATRAAREIEGVLEQQRRETVDVFVDLMRKDGIESAHLEVVDWIVRADGGRATSRSTSVLANLAADVERAVLVAILAAITEYFRWDAADGDEADAIDRLAKKIDRDSRWAVR